MVVSEKLGLMLSDEEGDQLSSFQVEFPGSTACVAPVQIVQRQIVQILNLVATALASSFPPPPKTFLHNHKISLQNWRKSGRYV